MAKYHSVPLRASDWYENMDHGFYWETINDYMRNNDRFTALLRDIFLSDFYFEISVFRLFLKVKKKINRDF